MKFNDYVQENGQLTKTGQTWIQGFIQNIKNELPADMTIQQLEVMQALFASQIGNYFSAEIQKKSEAERKYHNSKFASMSDEEFQKYLDDKNGTDIWASLVSLTEDEMMRYTKTQKI